MGNKIISNLDFYNYYIAPESELLAEINPNDVIVSRRPYVKQKEIVLINIGNKNRGDIAKQIQIISNYHPRIIGVHAFFNCEGRLRDSIHCPQLLDTLGNSMLEDAIKQAGPVVFVTKLLQTNQTSRNPNAIDVYDSLEYSDSRFSQFAQHGFDNLITDPPATREEDVKRCHSFVPKYTVNGETHLAFAVQIAMIYDPVKTTQFLARGNDEEEINFRFNVPRNDLEKTNQEKAIVAFDVEDVLQDRINPSAIENKIVLMGYMGDYFGDPTWSEKWFTPLNTKIAGTRNPDMWSVVIQANILSMILHEDYINKQNKFESFVINFWLCLLHVALLLVVRQKLHQWFDLMASMIIIIQISVVSYIRYFLFAEYSYDLFFSISVLTLAIAGIGINIYLELFPYIRVKLNKLIKKVYALESFTS